MLGARIEQLMGDLRSALTTTPPVRGAYQPRKGDLCAAKFDDGEWYG
jgi:staphylococcal nuclease domain-containing protein 1